MSFLTEEQKKKILQDAFVYEDARFITPEEVDELRRMFPNSASLKLLRKVFNVFTKEEEGIVSPVQEVYVGKPEATVDLASYGQAVLINDLADKKVRDSLAFIYQTIRTAIGEDLVKLAEEEAKTRKEEQDSKEKINKAVLEGSKKLANHL